MSSISLCNGLQMNMRSSTLKPAVRLNHCRTKGWLENSEVARLPNVVKRNTLHISLTVRRLFHMTQTLQQTIASPSKMWK